MRSVKPGRAPSFMGGIMSIFMALFGVLWMGFTAKIGGGMFSLFGLIFVAVAVVQAIFNFKNATGKNRYSSFDITDENEEPDPLNMRYGEGFDRETFKDDFGTESSYCPYCGTRIEGDFVYCNKCGKKLP